MKKIFLTLLMGLSSASLMAQFHLDGRPECMLGDELEIEDGPHYYRGIRKLGSQQSAPLKASGEQKIPVVLVQFADKPFTAADGTPEGVQQFYHQFCNGTMDGVRYDGHGSYGSIRDYFVEQSDSLFLPYFEVIGPVTLEQGYAYYGANSGGGHDSNFSVFRQEAIAKAQEVYTGDWMDFDNNGNGTVDMIFYVYAGLAESNGGDENCIWPKEGTTSTTINNLRYECYGCTCEARPSKYDNQGNITETKTDGVGVFIHELSHALGLPDFYDTRSVAFGMDIWSVMDYGEYGNNGYMPGNYTAYERDFMGWQPLVELTDTCVLNIKCFADGGCGYKIVNDANPDEYYVLENRQAKGWDEKICGLGHGLQVTHVDYNSSRWSANTVNTDPNHQRMTIISAADNYQGTNAAQTSSEWKECLGGCLFPGSSYNYNLTDDTTPAATVFAGSYMSKPLFDITEEEDGTVTVYFLKSKTQIEEEQRQQEIDALTEIFGNEESPVAVYALNGMCVSQCKANEVHRLSLRRGIYIIKYNNGATRKVFLD